MIKTTLPSDSAARKRYPLLRGALNYAPAAIAGMARISINGNDKHNPGEELHHARGKSMDHGDCIPRHLMDSQDIIASILRHEEPPGQAALDQLREEVDQLVWRAAMYSQEIHEKYLGAPLAPGARLPKAEPAIPGYDTALYVVFVERNCEYFLAPGKGTTPDIARAEVFTKAQASAIAGEGCLLRLAP